MQGEFYDSELYRLIFVVSGEIEYLLLYISKILFTNNFLSGRSAFSKLSTGKETVLRSLKMTIGKKLKAELFYFFVSFLFNFWLCCAASEILVP